MHLPPTGVGGGVTVIIRGAASVTGAEQNYAFDATSVSETEMSCDILQKESVTSG